ncbi:hypothetical protein SARC_03987 [Sphaeroforma arctica JP610]|uniref:Major facilitator superfamily (MFS) profile domain-containing protein n=1 Tax=Sphaeroforma arctica JP610 TaxID=667725 RepID=A0A0L0G4T1_9EUKA|nr:hypothetical protein SARC_03987 [Sphaeroforma arctica JP610]KNC83811.1 hypothetical protein SARC_03987 [Sphaeroforma arctica JP610]|eukprot:XP_014157713.1 hypothetical protein SARC_03987 [Sphaeroforma arctica JP610]
MESTVGLSSDPNLQDEKNDISLDDAVETGMPKQPMTGLVLGAAIIMSLQSFIFGCGIGMPNNSSPAMTYDGTGDLFPGEPATFDPPITSDQFSWILSLFAVGGMIGGLAGGTLVKMLGPKLSSLITDVVFIAAGFIMAFAPNYGVMMAGRIVLGVASGLCCNCVPIYNNDIAPVHVRGAFGVFHQLFITVGILVANVLGMQSVFGNPSLWWILWGSPVVFSGIHIVVMFFLPDSPKFLFEKGKDTQAKVALTKFRGVDYDATAELDEFLAAQKAAEEDGEVGLAEQFRILFSKSYIKQATIAIVLMTGQQLSGINAVMFYSNTIFASAGMTNAEVATIMVSAFNVVATFPAIPIIEKAGRKILLIGGFGGQGVMHIMFVVALIFEWQWPSVIFVLVGVAFFAVGPGPIPWMMAAELLPTKVSSAGQSVVVVVNWLFTFVIGLVYPLMNDALDEYSFLPFAVCCALVVVYTVLFVPETKGKTIGDIEAMFGNA